MPVDQAAGLGADDVQPMLVCPACGYEAPAAEPQSISTDQPQGAPPDPGLDPEQTEQTEVTDAAAEGDVCPNCGQAALIGPESAAEMGIGSGGMEEDPGVLEMGDPDAEPVDPRSEDPAQEDPQGPPVDPDDPDAEDDPEMEERGSPFPSKDDSEDEEEEPESDEEPEDDSDDSDRPAGKKFPPGKK
jgi:predicted RNA-binding Zn-ribbon protein involved in translation (DUF1610 family)